MEKNNLSKKTKLIGQIVKIAGVWMVIFGFIIFFKESLVGLLPEPVGFSAFDFGFSLFLSGIAFIFSGSYIRRRKKVFFILSVIFILLSIVTIFLLYFD